MTLSGNLKLILLLLTLIPSALAICGNYMVETGEECDDGNLLNGDGCNFNCKTEGLCSNPLDVMLVIDESGSMSQPMTKINDAKSAAREFVDILTDNDRVGLVSFETFAGLNNGLTYDHQRIKEKISALDPYGKTNIGHALNIATNEINGYGGDNRVLILLSDGAPNVDGYPGSYITCEATPTAPNDCTQFAVDQANSAKRSDIIIFTIGLGVTPFTQNLLQSIASTPYHYFYAPDSSDLSSIYSEIAQSLCYIECFSNNDCGQTQAYHSCTDNRFTLTTDIPVCENPGTAESYCRAESSSTYTQCNNVCSETQGCDYTQCSDTKDNDHDSTIDYPNDLGCDSYYDDNEADGPVACRTNADCGATQHTQYCENNNYFQTTTTYVCMNPGTERSYCDSSSSNDIQRCTNICDAWQGCDYTQCSDKVDNDADTYKDYPADLGCDSYYDNNESDGYVACRRDSDCGTPYNEVSCSNNHFLISTTSFICIGPGTEHSYCTQSTNVDGRQCQNICSEELGCDYTECSDTQDNDGDHDIDYPLDLGCDSFHDDNEADGFITCRKNADCGQSTTDKGCNGLTHFNEVTTFLCLNPGTEKSSCKVETDRQTHECSNICSGSEGCDYTQCSDEFDNDNDHDIDYPVDLGCESYYDNDESNGFVECKKDSDCGANLVWGECTQTQFIYSTQVYHCQNPATERSKCHMSSTSVPSTCKYICSDVLGCDYTPCSDSVDNDNDNRIDFSNDRGCTDYFDDDEYNMIMQCEDGSDNDRDGLIDMQDPGCSSPLDNDEGDKTTQCQDRMDNDGDGWIDLADPGCTDRFDNDEVNQGTNQCTDGMDNDGDGMIDGKDHQCLNKYDDFEGNDPVIQRNDADMLIERIAYTDHILPGDIVDFYINVRNRGDKDQNAARIQLLIPQLNIGRRAGPFKLEEGRSYSAVIPVEISPTALPGMYDYRIILYDKEVKRTQHGQIIIS